MMTPISPGAHGVDRAPKFDKGSVAMVLMMPPRILANLGIDEFASVSLKRRWGVLGG
jgi:hypothetical protein